MTTKAKVTWVEDARFVGQASSGHGVIIDGSDEKLGPSPMELVLMGLVGCTAYDVMAILTKKRQQVSGLVVSAEAQRADKPPRVYTQIHVEYVVHGVGISAKAVGDAIRLSEATYCSVAAMLNKTATITTSYRIVEQE